MRYEWFIGLRYLKAKRKQTFISIITVISVAGVMLGVMALIVVLSVMNGFQQTIKEKIIGTQAHIVVLKASEKGMDDYEEAIKKVEDVKGVVSAAPFIFSQVMLSSESGVSGVVLKGIDPDRVARVTELARNLKAGRLQDLKEVKEKDLPGIILGVELAKHLSVTMDDPIQVISPLGTMTPMGMMPKMKRFRVKGIFYSGMYEYDNTMAYVSLENAQKFFAMEARVTGIEIKTGDLYQVKEIGKEIRKKMGFPFWTKDWMEMNRNLFAALKLEKIIMFIIVVLIVLVAAFNIISTLIMVVMEKNKDVAILKSMGAPSKSILRIFMIEGGVIGVVGTVLGTITGLAVAFNLEKIIDFLENLFGFKILARDVYYIDKFPSQVNPLDVGVIVATAILISLLATLYPSWRASKLDPAEALRYE
ncbi:MAG: lipoprotein-releasing ABC transporter permease subunit [Deltaproteobacteria bacterium]|jgi:lipoprotein-releasing system permease protein|nr:lipoprotein-releasing ABC transporter permease subunit [Deltaproteobacteria bacterium]MBS3921305.1 lipoprotein-releasing ABC transporter permease subunit [Deltaproteobacteria bacterium]